MSSINLDIRQQDRTGNVEEYELASKWESICNSILRSTATAFLRVCRGWCAARCRFTAHMTATALAIRTRDISSSEWKPTTIPTPPGRRGKSQETTLGPARCTRRMAARLTTARCPDSTEQTAESGSTHRSERTIRGSVPSSTAPTPPPPAPEPVPPP